MKNNILSLFLIYLFFLFSSCVNQEGVPKSDPLNRLNWSEKNYQVLNQLIGDYGIGGQYYDKTKAPYAVLDWDQTCAHFDVEEALMRYQMFYLLYKMTKEQFAELLRNDINGVTRLSKDYQSVLLADIHLDLINDYNFLYDQFIGPQGKMTDEEIQGTLQYKDFVAKLPFLYAGYCDTPGIGDDYGYPWVLYLFTGHTIEGVKTMAREAVSYELGNRLAKQTLQSPADLQTKAGVISYSYKSGLRVFPEMQDLISTFKNHGIDVFIVSASYKPVVEVFSATGTFGYNVSPDHVIAMELNIDQNDKILPVYKTGWVKTYGHGKVEAINKVIKTGFGRNLDPLFSAGDSDGDYEMSTEFPEMKLSLIWDRGKGGKIGELCTLAKQQEPGKTPRYILQGRDENTGIAIPASTSVLFGKTNPEKGH
jgi:phosphoserine phosphatase